MRLLLTSAGLTNDRIADGLLKLVGKPLDEVSAAFIPTARNNRGAPVADIISDQTDPLDTYGLSYILVDPSDDDDWREALDQVDLVIIGGGNTFHLLNEARKSGFDTWLTDNLESKVYMGCSAGSILMTPDITVAGIDDGDENAVGRTDMTGLGFIDFEVSPHTPSDVSISANLEYSKTMPRRLLLLDDQSAVAISDRVEIISEGQWSWCQNGRLL